MPTTYTLITGDTYNFAPITGTALVFAGTGTPTPTNQKPTATLSGSTSGVTGTAQTFQATATDADGQVTMVELCLMANATTLTQFTVVTVDVFAPYALSWTPSAAGTFILRARATDNNSATGFSAPLQVVVTNPVPVSTGQTIRLSARGIVSDADLSMHPAFFGTNQRAAVQTLLNSLDPTYANTIINDCKFSVDAALELAGNTTWTNETDCGISLLPGKSEYIFQNKNKRGGRGTINTTGFDKNITITGGILNGAGYDASGTEQRGPATSNRAWPGLYYFAGVENLLIDQVTLLNARSIMGRIQNAKNAWVKRSKFANSPTLPDQSLRHDGPKFIGPCDNCGVEDCEIDQRGDDLFSFCACDIWSATPGKVEPDGSGIADYDEFASYGPMTACVGRNVKAIRGVKGYHGVRLMNKGQKQDVLLDNIYGDVGEYLVTMDNYSPTELFGATGGTADALFGTVRIQNCSYTLIPNFDAAYYKGQNPNDTTYDGASLIVRARVDSLQLENCNELSGYSARNPLLILDYAGSIADMYGNDVVVAGVPSPPRAACIFRGSVGGTRGNLFAGNTAPVGVQRLPASNAPFVVAPFNEPTYFSFTQPNKVLFLTDATGVTTHTLPLYDAVEGNAGQLHVVNEDTVSHFIHIPDNQSPLNTDERYILVSPGERVDFLICCYHNIVGWWVDRNPTAALGIAAVVPAGYKYAVAPCFVFDETNNPYYLQLSGAYRRDAGNQYDSGSAIVIEPQANGQVLIPGALCVGIGLFGPTDTQYKGKFHLYVTIDGGTEFEVTPQPTQVASPNAAGSYVYYSYRYDSSFHFMKFRIQNDATEPQAYYVFDGYQLLAS